MKHQLQTIRAAIELATPHYQADTERFKQALTALAELERLAGEPFAHFVYFPDQQRGEFAHELEELCEDMTNDENHEVTPLFTAPVAQQPQAEAPTPAKNGAAPVASWNDSRTQKVYEVLTNDNYPPKGSEEHWEGWKARLVVDALFPAQPQAEVTPMSQPNRLIAYSAAAKLRELGYEWDEKAEAWAPQQAEAVPAKEDFCYCNDEISLQIVSGGGAPEGLYGRVTLRVNGEYVNYVRADSWQETPRARALEFVARHKSSDWPERCQQMVNMARAALAAPQQADAVPPSWPTNAMIEAGRKAAASHGPLLGNGQSLWHIFRDMYAAAPQQAEAYNKTELNAFVQDLYDRKMREGKHGHYETLFHCVHQAIKRVGTQSSPAWEHHAQKLTKWLHCMSYNDSYFGEPAGLVKQVTGELNRLIGTAPQQAEAVPPDVLRDAARYRALRSIENRLPAAVFQFHPGTALPNKHMILVGGHLDAFCDAYMMLKGNPSPAAQGAKT